MAHELRKVFAPGDHLKVPDHIYRVTRQIRLRFRIHAIFQSTFVRSLVWEGTFHGRFENKPYAMKVFEANNEEVRRRVSPERLLVFDVREGWGPLCEFLGVKTPDRPFPRLNESREMRRRLLGLVAVSAAAPVVAAVVGIVATAFLIRRILGLRQRQ